MKIVFRSHRQNQPWALGHWSNSIHLVWSIKVKRDMYVFVRLRLSET
jgi:hypothetical protein